MHYFYFLKTKTDFKAERNYIFENVYPELRKYYREKQMDFIVYFYFISIFLKSLVKLKYQYAFINKNT